MGGLSDTEGIISRFPLIILKPLHKPLEKILLDPLVKKLPTGLYCPVPFGLLRNTSGLGKMSLTCPLALVCRFA